MNRIASRLARAVLALVTVLASLAFSPDTAVQAATGLPSQATRTAAVDRALAWLRSQQTPDGSYGASVGNSLEVVLAAAAAGQDVSTWRNGSTGASLLDYVRANGLAYAIDGAKAGKLVAAVVAIGQDPYAWEGADLVALLRGMHDGKGIFAETTIGQAWAISAFLAARAPLPAGALDALLALQQKDGGWEAGPGWGTDSNATAFVLQTLRAAGLTTDSQAIRNGSSYLAKQVAPQGGFTYSAEFGDTADANSTAYGLQALISLGENPAAGAWTGTATAVDALLGFQLANGAFAWQADSGANLLATAQAIPALLGKALPLEGTAPAIRAALSFLRTKQQADGSFPSEFGGSYSTSVYALMALASAGEDPTAWHGADGASLMDYLAAGAQSVDDAGSAGRLVTALVLAGVDPTAFGGANLVGVIRADYDPSTGAYNPNGDIYSQALALWGLAAAGEDVPSAAITWLTAKQNVDGGWGWAEGQTSDSNTTGIVLQALTGAGLGATDPDVAAAAAYLGTQQVAGGGFAYDIAAGTGADANSTATAIQGVLAAGTDPAQGWNWAVASGPAGFVVARPADALLSLQFPEGAEDAGAFEWQAGAGANLLATLQAIPALAGIAFPAEPVEAVQSVQPLDADTPANGTLTGKAGGRYAYYTLRHPGKDRTVSLKLRFTPGDPTTANGFGMIVYGEDGAVVGTAGYQGGGVLALDLASEAPANWLVQVYNYLPGVPVAYSLTASGIPATYEAAAEEAAIPTEVVAEDQGATAQAFEGSAMGALVGARTGAFAHYTLTAKAGDEVALTLRFTPADPMVARGVSLTVYGPSGMVSAGAADSAGALVARFVAAESGDYTVQVACYGEGITLQYTLTR
ncbi:MAG: prenyltransferase/squalene oxidase repeat-containing protein [Anaerolineae bacterium]